MEKVIEKPFVFDLNGPKTSWVDSRILIFKRARSFAIFLIFATIIGLAYMKVIVPALDRPQAASYDEGKTISYFVINANNPKGEEIVGHNDPRFKKIKDKGEYDLRHIERPESAKIPLSEYGIK